MGFEPRMRGRRFRRSPAKKKSAKDRSEQREASTFYEEAPQIDASQVLSSTMNALEHLGNQRFPLPPYSEHFQRWMKDVATLLSDFERQLPEAADEHFRKNTTKILSDLQLALNQRTKTESDVYSKLAAGQRRLAANQSDLSKLDQDYKTQTHEIRRRHEQSSAILRKDIHRLDQERLRILHTRPTLLQRLLRMSDVSLEEKANALRSKKNALDDRKEALKHDLEELRAEYERNRKEITKQLAALRTELKESDRNKQDDGLELRKVACKSLRREVDEAVDRRLEQKNPSAAERES
jgi:hypothetical protein